MLKPHSLTSVGLFAILAITAGCGKKSESDSDSRGGSGGPPAPGGVVEKMAKEDAVKRLKQIGLAMHNFESSYGAFPAGVVGPKGELGLSWRVQILPFLEDRASQELAKQFKMNESWDSEHNKKLLSKMPSVFASPGKEAPQGKTYLRSFVGESAFIPAATQRSDPMVLAPKGKTSQPPFANMQPGLPAPSRRITGISDGTSNTLMVAEATEPVEWTKPDELPFPGFPGTPNPPPVPKLGGPFLLGFHGLMCDGSVHFFPNTLGEKTVAAMISATGGEVLPEEATAILFPPDPKKASLSKSIPDDLPDAAARYTAVANYRAIHKAIRQYHDFYLYLPSGIAADKAVGLSWRVQILPNLGEEKLYKEFKLNEPWNSEHNKKLIEKMPKLFASPGRPAMKGHTFVRTTQGPQGIIQTGPDGKMQWGGRQPGQPVPGRSLAAIPDGTSLTILFVEAGEAVPWTKPDELFLPMGDPLGKGPVPKLPMLGGVFADGFHATMADGRITFYQKGYPSADVFRLLGPADGLIVETLGHPDQISYSIPLPAAPAGKAPGKLK